MLQTLPFSTVQASSSLRCCFTSALVINLLFVPPFKPTIQNNPLIYRSTSCTCYMQVILVTFSIFKPSLIFYKVFVLILLQHIRRSFNKNAQGYIRSPFVRRGTLGQEPTPTKLAFPSPYWMIQPFVLWVRELREFPCDDVLCTLLQGVVAYGRFA